MLCAKRLLLAQLVLAVLAGLLQLGSGVREGSSVVTPKLLKLKEQQAEQDAEWKPMDLAAFAPLAKLRGVERHGMDNAEVFEQLDTDGSGTLSKSEVAGLKELVEKYVEKKRSSQNPEDMVTYEEFEAKFQPGGEYEADTWLDREYKADGGLPHIFNRLDVDKDHQLSPDEIQHLGYFLGRESGGIKLNEDALYLEIYDQEVPSESNSPKPDL